MNEGPKHTCLRPVFAGIILAAGAGSRMGHPKAIIKTKGKHLASLHANTLLKAGCTSVHVVLGAEFERIERQLTDLPTKTSISQNFHWQRGPFSSLKTGIEAPRAISTNTWFFVLPIDTAPIGESTLTKMIVHSRSPSPEAVIPTYKNKKGHPVLISPSLVNTISNTCATTGRLDHILRNCDHKLVECDDPAVVTNLNYVKDLSCL